jgi:hypothetical protein
MFHGFPTGMPSAVSSRAEPGLAMCVTLKVPSHIGVNLDFHFDELLRLVSIQYLDITL